MTNGNLSAMGRKLLPGSALRLASLFTAVISSLWLMPFVVHHLGDRLYGFWTLAATFAGYYGLLDFGLSSAVSQYLGMAIGQNDSIECSAIFNTALRIQLLLGGVVLFITGVLVVAAPWVSRDPVNAALFTKVVAILGLNMAVWFPARAYGGILEAQLQFDVQAGLGMLTTLLRTLLIVFAILNGGGLLAMAWMTLLASLPAVALHVYFVKRCAPWAQIHWQPTDKKRVAGFFSYSIYTFLSVIGDIFRFQVDSVVIAWLIGLVAVTHYRVASVFMKYYIDIVMAIVGIAQPVMSRLYGAKDRENLEKVMFFATRVSLCVSSFIGFGLIFWGRPFINRWMGPEYQDAYWPLVALSFAVMLDVGQSPSVALLYATFKHRFYTYLNCGEGLLNLVVSVLLVKPLGVLGVALGTLIAAFIVRALAQPFWVCKATGVSYRKYMRFLGETLLRSAVLIAAVVAISAWGLRPSYPALISSALCATAMFIVGAWFAVFNRTERERLWEAVMNRKGTVAESCLTTSIR